MALTADAVRALAPDSGALKSGQSLASERHWKALAHSERAAWGRCQGSGPEPYGVMVDLAEPAARCTCPSRKFPCKHGLALLFLAADGKAGPAQDEPAEVATWLAGRTRRATVAAERAGNGSNGATATAEVDEKTARARERDRQRRASQREGRVAEGLDEFRRWLRDLARRGLADVDDPGAYESAAARLVDAQAGELARSVRALARTIARGGAAGDGVIDRIGLLYLISETWDRRDRLDERLTAELRSRIGWTTRESDLPEAADITDRWWVVARRHEDDDRLRETRTWLRGTGTGRWIVLLDFAPVRSDPVNEPPVGASIDGRVAIYPGASGLRGALRAGWQRASDPAWPNVSEDHTAALATYAAAVGSDPFLERWPLAIADVRCAWDRDTTRLALVDRRGDVLPTRFTAHGAASLLAYAGGGPVSVAGEWDGHALDVLAVGDGASWVALADTESTAELTTTAPAVGSASASAPDDAAWAAVTALATLGTARAQPDPALEPLVARMADRTPEDRSLALMSALSVRRRVGRRPTAAPAELPILPSAATESLTRPPTDVSAALREPVRQQLRDERLTILLRNSWLVPPELLAAPSMAPPVPDPAVLGRRAAWLSRYLSGYRPWGADVDGSDRDELVRRLEDPTTAPVERGGYLRRFRAVDPDAARAWLEAAWPRLGMNDKAMIVALEVGLGEGDTPFLEQALTERNRDRRVVVARLLAGLPRSSFVTRLEARGRTLLVRKGRFGTGLRLVVPPDAMRAELEADGHTVSTHQWSGGPARTPEDRAWEALDWHLRLIRPARWGEWLGLSVGQVVEELTGLAPARWGLQPMSGLAAAAVRHRDRDMATVILGTGFPLPQDADDLWVLIPEREREPIALAVLATQPRYDTGEAVMAALRAVPEPWTARLRDTAAREIDGAVGRLDGRDRWSALARLRALVTAVPADLLPGVIERLTATDADSRDIIEIAQTRHRFAAIVAEARGTTP